MKAYKDSNELIYLHCQGNVYEIYTTDKVFISLSSISEDLISQFEEIEFSIE